MMDRAQPGELIQDNQGGVARPALLRDGVYSQIVGAPAWGAFQCPSSSYWTIPARSSSRRWRLASLCSTCQPGAPNIIDRAIRDRAPTRDLTTR
jgi:hypothetical protein